MAQPSPTEWDLFWKVFSDYPGKMTALLLGIIIPVGCIAWFWAWVIRSAQIDALRERLALAEDRAKKFIEDSEFLRKKLSETNPEAEKEIPPSPKIEQSGTVTFDGPERIPVMTQDFGWTPKVSLSGKGANEIEIHDLTTSSFVLIRRPGNNRPVTVIWTVSE